jgi:hypothetical protein
MLILVKFVGKFCFQRKHLTLVSIFGKRLSREINNVAVCPLAFHVSVQQPFKPSGLAFRCTNMKIYPASFPLCFKSLLPASEEFVSQFPSPKQFSASDSYLLDLSGLEDPTFNSATAGSALRVTCNM